MTWEIKDYSDDKKGYIRIIDGDKTICDIFPFAGVGGVGREEALANARKIVAASASLDEAIAELEDGHSALDRSGVPRTEDHGQEVAICERIHQLAKQTPGA